MGELEKQVQELIRAEFRAEPWQPSPLELRAGEEDDATLFKRLESEKDLHVFAMRWEFKRDKLHSATTPQIAQELAGGITDVVREIHRARELLRSPKPESYGGHA